MRSDHKWSLETLVEMHFNARCERMYLSCPLMIGSPGTMVMPGLKRASEHQLHISTQIRVAQTFSFNSQNVK